MLKISAFHARWRLRLMTNVERLAWRNGFHACLENYYDGTDIREIKKMLDDELSEEHARVHAQVMRERRRRNKIP